LVFKNVIFYEIEVGIYEKFAKMFTKKSRLAATLLRKSFVSTKGID